MTEDGRKWLERDKPMTMYQLLEVALAGGLYGFRPESGSSFLFRKVVCVDGEWWCFVDALEEEGVVLCTSFFPIKAVGERGPEVRSLVATLNSFLQAGVFEVYGDDGQVVVRMPVRVEVFGVKGVELVARAVREHLLFVDFHIPLFQSVECGASSVNEIVGFILEGILGGDSGEKERLICFFGSN